jgi:hypothetical protein
MDMTVFALFVLGLVAGGSDCGGETMTGIGSRYADQRVALLIRHVRKRCLRGLEHAPGYRLTLATGYDTNARPEQGSAQLICL